MAPCEWVIDIIKEWVQNQVYATQAWVTAKGYSTEAWVLGKGYLQTSFVHRPPGGSWDWIAADLTADNAWHGLDCSSIVPAGAKAILFYIYTKKNTVAHTIMLRYPSDPFWYACPGIFTQVANVGNACLNLIPCSTPRHIEYRLTPGVWTAAQIYIIGWCL